MTIEILEEELKVVEEAISILHRNVDRFPVWYVLNRETALQCERLRIENKIVSLEEKVQSL
jgi:hypothetical protein